MMESDAFLKHKIMKKFDNLLTIANAILAWGLFHYTVYLVYSVFKFITG